MTNFFLSDNGFVNTKAEASTIRDSEAIEMIEEWLHDNAIPAKKKYKDSSYALKHRVEEELKKYITNGAFIQACINIGLKVERIEGGLNGWIFAEFVNNNPIKIACKDFHLTYSQLSEQIGYGEEAISKAARTGEISKPMTKALELFSENMRLKAENQTLDDLKNIIQKVITRN